MSAINFLFEGSFRGSQLVVNVNKLHFAQGIPRDFGHRFWVEVWSWEFSVDEGPELGSESL